MSEQQRDDEPTVDDRDAGVAATVAVDGPAMPRPTLPATPRVARRSKPRISASVFDPPADRFDEQDELGRGGMGRVALALDRALGRPVAIKHSLATTPVDLARFEREVRITARLQHPGIVPILDAGRDPDGQPFYIMRKIDGDPLASRVTGAKTVRDRLALVPAVLGAVDAAAYAHASGIVHRDIKPWNILLGPFGETLLIDWGLARELEAKDDAPSVAPPTEPGAGLTRVGSAYGTPGFMAPEQARGEPVDRRADVYSLGATLYFVLAGKLPLDVEGSAAISHAAAGRGPDLDHLPPEIPVELTAIARKALAAEPAHRYADAGELATDLRRFLAGQLVAAHAYTATERIARWLRRHRIAAAIAAIAIVTIAATAVLSVDRVISERDQAREARALAESRAEEMLVDRARVLVELDPTSAVALLRGLPASSPLWPVAREIVRAAIPAGVERSLVSRGKYVTALAFSPTGELASSSYEGDVQLHDLALRTSRVIARGTAHHLGWLDERTLVTSTTVNRGVNQLEMRVAVVDTVTATERVLDVPAIRSIAITRGRFAIMTRTGAVTLYDRALVATPIASKGAELIDAADGHVVALGRNKLIAVAPDGTRRERELGLTEELYGARISDRGERVAVWTRGRLREWRIDGREPPREWARHEDHPSRIAYVGQTLYAWANDGSGVLAFDGPVPVPCGRWQGEPIAIAVFEGGALFASEQGSLGYVDELGAVELSRRRLDLSHAAIDRAGRRAVTATKTGELLVIDLGFVRPQLVPVGSTTRIVGAAGEHAIVDSARHVEGQGTGPSNLTLVDLRTRERTAIGEHGFAASAVMLDDGFIVQAPMQRRVVVFDLRGQVQLVIEGAHHTAIGTGLAASRSVFYISNDGELFEQPLEPRGPRRLLATYEVDPRPTGRVVLVSGLEPTGEGLFVSRYVRAIGAQRHEVFTRDGRRDVALGLTGWDEVVGRTPDGATWFTLDERLYRVPAIGPPMRIELPGRVIDLRVIGGEPWAITDRTMYQIAADGRIVRTAALAGRDRKAWLRDGFLLTAADGLVVTTPTADVRRELPLPRGIVQAAGSWDGRTILALVQRGDERALAVWRDPVPVDPAAVPAFLEQLTNARLALGSDAVTFGP